MANLPESFYVDPTVSVGNGANRTPAPLKPAQALAAPVNLRTASPEQLIALLNDVKYREEALALLNKVFAKKTNDIALPLWNSFNVVHILLQEVISVYRLLSPPNITIAQSNRVCNALALFQCIASHPDTRMKMIHARIPVYLYPFMKLTQKERPYEYLKLASLGVIGGLVKIEDSNSPQVALFLIESEMFPYILACLEHGNELIQTVATYIISKILMQREGIRYFSLLADRFYVLTAILAKTVDNLPAEPPVQLLRHIISCFYSLAEVPRIVAKDALKRAFPARLTDPKFVRVAYEDPATRPLLESLLQEVNAGPWSKVEPMIEVLKGPRSKK